MSRHDVTEPEWNAIRRFLPIQHTGRPGRPWTCHRTVLNGIFWILATGAPWRDLPEEFGKWQTVYKRFRQWTLSGLWQKIWQTLVQRLRRFGQLGFRLWMVDGSIVRAHQAAVGGCSLSRNQGENALGRSRGGFSSKLHVVCEENGIPLGIVVTAGQINEPTVFETLMEEIPFSLHRKASRPEAVAGDKAYVARYIFDWIAAKGIQNVIPNRKNENLNPEFNRGIYRMRNLVERLIGRIKQLRRIATRYEKTLDSYLSMIYLAFLRITSKSI